jgi:hypothetical protein
MSVRIVTDEGVKNVPDEEGGKFRAEDDEGKAVEEVEEVGKG